MSRRADEEVSTMRRGNSTWRRDRRPERRVKGGPLGGEVGEDGGVGLYGNGHI